MTSLPSQVVKQGNISPGLTLRERLSQDRHVAYLYVFPAVALLLVFTAYPFLLGIWLSLTDKSIGNPVANFVGLKNFADLLSDDIFQQTFKNTITYTVVTVVVKAVLGLALALLMNESFPFKNAVRASLLLPWIVPTALSTLAWLWIFDPTFSILNWILWHAFHIPAVSWLGEPAVAMGSIISVNIWRGVPFFAISLLAGLQTIPQELYEAASIDGAGALHRFRSITLPLVQPVMLLVILFSFIWTIADFQLVFILTRGGPANMTHLFGTYAYQVSVMSTKLGEGAAISLYMLPFLLICIGAVLWEIRRDKGEV